MTFSNHTKKGKGRSTCGLFQNNISLIFLFITLDFETYIGVFISRIEYVHILSNFVGICAETVH